MDKNIRNLILLVAVVLLITGSAFYFLWAQGNAPGKYDSFAQCLKTKGLEFYGAFWCPHCQNQKALFGNSEKYLPYVECSTPDSNGQLQVCINKKIEVYPTWIFADGSKNEGEMTFQELADKSGCALP